MKSLKAFTVIVSLLLTQFSFAQTEKETVDWLNKQFQKYRHENFTYEIRSACKVLETTTTIETNTIIRITSTWNGNYSSNFPNEIECSFTPDVITSSETLSGPSIKISSSEERILCADYYNDNLVLYFDKNAPHNEVEQINKGILHLLEVTRIP